ncbi:MAG: hypothetical protein JXQ73_01250 [Phycisphaerae bacterium]|nr:hypothetical protein [Phycisphaerae bacterium]
MTDEKPSTSQLVSYIAPGAPATRRPGRGDEPFLRPEIGFTPKWYRQAVGVDFGRRWHTDAVYRDESIRAMARALRRRFRDVDIGWVEDPESPPDLLTGVFGACTVGGIYGLDIVYASDQWPVCEHTYLTDGAVDALQPPDLDRNPFFNALMDQLGRIADRRGRVFGYVNWQGVLNNAYRLRGEDLFADMLLAPARANHLFQCVALTMEDAARRLYAAQRQTGVSVEHFTVSNCLVNMIGPEQYGDMLLRFDRRFSEAFGLLGVHNCAWTADAYLDHYATLPNLGYVDMGADSDLGRARALFPQARRAVMYTPMDLANKALDAIRADLERFALEYGPCDVVLADIEADTPDSRVVQVVEFCGEVSRRYGPTPE